MCAQCWIAAATATTAATGLRAWFAARSPSWLSPSRLRLLTVCLLGLAVLAAGARLS